MLEAPRRHLTAIIREGKSFPLGYEYTSDVCSDSIPTLTSNGYGGASNSARLATETAPEAQKIAILVLTPPQLETLSGGQNYLDLE